MKHHQHTLSNGLTIIGEHQIKSRSLALGFFARTGARDETQSESGVSHFLEHMLFKGTLKRSPDDVNRDFDAMGARYNAFTSNEETVYYGACLPEFQLGMTELLSDMMRPALRQSDFDMEKKVILEEIAMYQDKPMSQVWDALKKQFYGSHPLGQSILGTTQSISDLTREQMHDYFERRYAPNNLTFVLSGQFDFDAAVSQIEELCGDWNRADAPREFPSVSSTKGISVSNTDKFARAHLALMGPGFSAQDERRFAASLACDALGAGDASRLYWALVHPGLAEAAQVGHSASDGSGTFTGVVICTPDRAQMALDVFRAEMEKACEEGLGEAEIERARRRLASSMTLGAETPMGRLRPVGFNWMYRRELLSPQDSLERLMNVSVAQVNEVLSTKPFESSSIVSVGPVEALV